MAAEPQRTLSANPLSAPAREPVALPQDWFFEDGAEHLLRRHPERASALIAALNAFAQEGRHWERAAARAKTFEVYGLWFSADLVAEWTRARGAAQEAYQMRVRSLRVASLAEIEATRR